jgi:hypothetical protein
VLLDLLNDAKTNATSAPDTAPTVENGEVSTIEPRPVPAGNTAGDASQDGNFKIQDAGASAAPSLVSDPAAFQAAHGVKPLDFARYYFQISSASGDASYAEVAYGVLSAIQDLSASGTTTLQALLTAKDAGKWVRAGDDSHLEITSNGKTMTLAQYWASNGARPAVSNTGVLGSCFNDSTNGNILSNPEPECDAMLINGPDADTLSKLSTPQVNNLSPAVVFGILKYLGFQMTNNNGLNEVQSWKSWWANTPSEVKDNLTGGSGNPLTIKGFLERAIVFINSNPAILNKGANLKCEDKAGYGLRCVSAKHNPKSFDEFRSQIDLTLNKFRGLPMGMMGMGSVGFTPYGMMGGGAAVPIALLPSGRGSVGRLPEFTRQVRSLYAGFVSRLETMKKTLSASTKTQIEDVFKQTQAKEDEAKKLLGWFEKYAQVTQMTGDRSASVYTENDLKQASDNFSKVLGKYRRRLYSLVDIVSVASQAVNDAELKSMSM